MSSTASATVRILNRLGLHARPAMMFVETATGFDADITVRRTDQDEAVDGKSIMHMMVLAATLDTELEICANGSDAADAVNALVDLVGSRFSEE